MCTNHLNPGNDETSHYRRTLSLSLRSVPSIPVQLCHHTGRRLYDDSYAASGLSRRRCVPQQRRDAGGKRARRNCPSLLMTPRPLTNNRLQLYNSSPQPLPPLRYRSSPGQIKCGNESSAHQGADYSGPPGFMKTLCAALINQISTCLCVILAAPL